MTYLEAIQYLESLINYEKIPDYPYKESLKLERFENFLTALNNPQSNLKCIHIAGTKGKGSTCAFITYILRETGYKVGLYTSPHLSDFRERIRILNPKSEIRNPKQIPKLKDFEGIIPQDELTDLVERLKPLIERYNRNSAYGPLSFFEVYTALAFIYFKKQKVDFVVLETGLGGRLDATNVVNPLVCAITPISYEHTQKLGNTLREIATEKAGIIKSQKSKINPSTRFRIDGERSRTIKNQKLIVISAPQEPEAREAIRSKCKETQARLYEVGKDIVYERIKGEGLRVKGIFGEYPGLKIRLLGEHQLINATVAIGVIQVLQFYNIKVGIDAIRKGLYNTVWPGRCEVVSENPLIVLDGAQNVASSRALKETIKRNFKSKKLILVLGISNDKDIKGICDQLDELVDEVILTKANNPRATEPQVLVEYFRDKDINMTSSVKEAIKLAQRKASKEDLVLVTGSLFLVGEARKFLLTKYE